MNSDTNFTGLMREDGRYQLVLSIPIYGLIQKHGFHSEYKPMLGVKAQMTDPLGKVVWEYYDYVSGSNSDTLGFKYEKIF